MAKKYIFPITIILAVIAASYFIILPKKENPTDQGTNKPSPTQSPNTEERNPSPPSQFLGEKGERIELVAEQINIPSDVSGANSVRYYHTELPSGRIIYFFVVKDEAGVYRAAANACQVCFSTKMGFRQEENFMTCNACGNKYPLEKIATEKGGCNPSPINSNLPVENGKIIIRQSELEQVADFF